MIRCQLTIFLLIGYRTEGLYWQWNFRKTLEVKQKPSEKNVNEALFNKRDQLVVATYLENNTHANTVNQKTYNLDKSILRWNVYVLKPFITWEKKKNVNKLRIYLKNLEKEGSKSKTLREEMMKTKPEISELQKQ